MNKIPKRLFMMSATALSVSNSSVLKRLSPIVEQSKDHHSPDGGFRNPWPSFSPRDFSDVFKWQLSRKKGPKEPSAPAETVEIDWEKIQRLYNGEASPSTKFSLTWLGHAAFLMTAPGVRILFDPCLSDRCSPMSFMGPKRIQKLPFELSALPPIDCVVISHNHYDHLDLPALEKITHKNTYFFVPLGVKKLLISEGYEHVVECDWWDQYQLSVGGKSIQITCSPCQHFSSRSLFDRNETLWSSWIVKANSGSFYFAGDTGYKAVSENVTPEIEAALPVCPAFKTIGKEYGKEQCNLISQVLLI